MTSMQPREEIVEKVVVSGSEMRPVVKMKTCRSCYHQLQNKLCACREKVDIQWKGCDDWYPKENR